MKGKKDGTVGSELTMPRAKSRPLLQDSHLSKLKIKAFDNLQRNIVSQQQVIEDEKTQHTGNQSSISRTQIDDKSKILQALQKEVVRRPCSTSKIYNREARIDLDTLKQAMN